MPSFRIETFGSFEYDFDEITLRDRRETLEFLEKDNLLQKYRMDFEKLWAKKESNVSLFNLRLPALIQLDYTYKCNLSCKYCYSASSPSRTELMKIGEFKRIIRLIDREDIFELHILGGEPLLFPKYVKYALNNIHKKIVTIASNGTLITEDICKWIMDSSSLVSIGIGIDGHDEYTHNAVRGGFNKMCNALELLHKYGIQILATTCVTRHNYEKLEDILRFLLRHNVSGVQIIPVETSHLPTDVASELDIRNLYFEIVPELIRLVNAYKDRINIDVSFSLPFLEPRGEVAETITYGPCAAGIVRAYINPRGELALCPVTPFTPTARITHSIEESFKCLKKKLKKSGRGISLKKGKLSIQKCCELFGYGQRPRMCQEIRVQ